MLVPTETWNGIELHYMSDELIVAAYGLSNAAEQWTTDFSMFSDESIAKFKAFCEREGFWYYAAPKEDFFVHEGIEQAMKAGLRKVILDNLS